MTGESICARYFHGVRRRARRESVGVWRAMRPALAHTCGGAACGCPSDAAGAQAARLIADLRSPCLYAPPLLRLRRGCHQVDVSFPEIEKFDHLPARRAEGACTTSRSWRAAVSAAASASPLAGGVGHTAARRPAGFCPGLVDVDSSG